MSGASAANSKKVASCSESIVLFVEKGGAVFLVAVDAMIIFI